MKKNFPGLIAMLILATFVASESGFAAGAPEQDTFGSKIKRFFAGPSPTPRRHKKPTPKPTPEKESHPKRSRSESTSPTPTPTPTESPSESPSTERPQPSLPPPVESPSPQAQTAASPAASPASLPNNQFGDAQPQYLEPVRPINPGPHGSRPPRPKPTTPLSRKTPTPTPSETPVVKASPAKAAIFSSADLAESGSYPSPVAKVVDVSLGLSNQHLTYKYNSADPAKGGMDSSGFVQYVLSQAGVKDVPRDARDQYIWVRKAGNFQAVLSQKDDSFELEALKPGDLLFWATPFSVSKEPEITQTMIYLGRDKATNQRLMIGASEKHPFKGQTRSGVNVFDFKVARPKSEKEPNAVFVGYGRAPGLPSE